MSKNIIKAVVFSIGLAVAGAAQGFVGSIAVGLGEMNEDIGRIQVSFAADAMLETEDMKANTRIHYQPGKVRDEMDMGGDQRMVTIRRFDLNKVWMIMPQGMYIESDADKGSEQAPDYKLVSREVIGREVVNGMDTTKYKSVYESKDGKFGGFTWYTDDNIAVKGFMISETKGKKERIKFEITNLERGSQDDSLFEIPAGYQKLNMGGMAGMGNMGQMQQQQQAGQSGQAPSGAQPQSNPGGDGSGESDGLGEKVADEAEDTASEEIVKGIGGSVKKGIGKLFGR